MINPDPPLAELAALIKTWGRELGFQQIGIADIALSEHETRLLDWLAAGFHGEMDYMARHGVQRSRPAEPGSRHGAGHRGADGLFAARSPLIPGRC